MTGNIQLVAINDFEKARWQTWWSRLWAWLQRKSNQLIALDELEASLPKQRLYRGIQEIPVEQIVGSVNRAHEFDRQFNPLRDSLEQRWVGVRVLASTTGFAPIQVYQVGNLYFVEDGHHRVSVNRQLGNSVIEALVWEYPLDHCFDLQATTAEVMAQLQPKPATLTDSRVGAVSHSCGVC